MRKRRSARRRLGRERKIVGRLVVEARQASEALRIATAARGAAKAPVEVRMRFLEVADDLEVDALDLREVDLLDVDEAQQLAHRARHLAAALVAGAAALRYTNCRPELLLIEPEALAQMAGFCGFG